MQENPRQNLKVLQGQATAERLLKIARALFAQQGYANTKTEDIIQQGGVTKGALYHHYSSKKRLFEAVYLSLEEEVAEKIMQASARHKDPWYKILNGCYAYLDACHDPQYRRIMRVDAPSVLGMKRWSEIDRAYGVERLIPAMKQLVTDGVIKTRVVEAFTWQLTGAMNEATFWIAQHSDPTLALRQSKTALRTILESIKIN
ncbi:MAG: TetR/AcrR family transcriptional regulator [Pseudomonadota bacterium]